MTQHSNQYIHCRHIRPKPVAELVVNKCSHKCCIAAHKDGKSCVRCNPNKEDLKQEAKKGQKK